MEGSEMSGHDWELFDFDSGARCKRCGWTGRATVARRGIGKCSPIGVDHATQPDATSIVKMEKGTYTGMRFIESAADFHDTRPADARAKANGPWASIMGDDVSQKFLNVPRVERFATTDFGR
jgi:hypothetical protein